MDLFDLEKHFAFYGAYHSNPVNILIHMVFVWPNFFTSLMLLYFIPTSNFPNSALLYTALYAVYYVGLDRKAGLLGAVLCVLCYYGAVSLATTLGFSLAWKIALAAQLICWTFQVIGHGIFEKRSPAFVANFFPAFIMAPFFVVLEATQHFFGYEPYPGFHAKVMKMADAEIKEWKEKTQKKSS